jgi:hypothetical protein
MEYKKYPIKEITRLNLMGNRCYYIRIPAKLAKSGLFPVDNLSPLLITIESKDRIVITRLK